MATLNGRLVWVVDDDPVVRLLVAECLGAAGHRVKCFESGRECLAELPSGIPDLLIIDMQMPHMTGAEVIRTIRCDATISTLPIILLSANTERDSRRAQQDGERADRCLEKPFQMRELIAAVAELATA